MAWGEGGDAAQSVALVTSTWGYASWTWHLQSIIYKKGWICSTCACLGDAKYNRAWPNLPYPHSNTSSPTLPGEPGSYWPMRATYWEKAAMKLGRGSQSMSWILLPWHYLSWVDGVGDWKKKQTQISWYRGTSTITLLPLPPSTHSHHSAFKHPFHSLPSGYSFAVLSFLWFACPWAHSTVCLCVYESSLKWRIDSPCSIFLIWLTSQSTPYFSPYLLPPLFLFLRVSQYDVGEWECLRGVLNCSYKRRVWKTSVLGVSAVCFALYLYVCACIFVFILKWIRMLRIQECTPLYKGQELVSVLWPLAYCIFDSTTEEMPNLFFIFILVVQLLWVQEDSLEGMCPQRFVDTPHQLVLQ